MSPLPLLFCPDPRLRQVSSPVETIDDEVRDLFKRMLITMEQNEGMGLAAPQVGIFKRLVVIDIQGLTPSPLKMVNPEITWRSEETELFDDGCLSVPNFYQKIKRHSQVSVRYQDEFGAIQDLTGKAYLSACIQHEIDHLNGILFIDYLSPLKRQIFLNKLSKNKVPSF